MTTSQTSTLRQPAEPAPKTAPTGAPNLAFVGLAGAGKSTAAQYLAAQHGYTHVSFAAPLKRCAAVIWETPTRDQLQRLGIAIRGISPGALVSHASGRIDGTRGTYVIDDCRFEDEYWALKERGFVFVEVLADNWQREGRLKANGKHDPTADMNHVSENSLEHLPKDYTIENTSASLDFIQQIDTILNRETRKR